MPISEAVLQRDRQAAGDDRPAVRFQPALGLLRRTFAMEFHLVDGESGDLIHGSPDQPAGDWNVWGELCRQVAESGRPQLIADEPPLAVLAVPLADDEDRTAVAVAAFTTRPGAPGEDLSHAAHLLGLDGDEASRWAACQTPWAPESLEQVGRLVMEQAAATARIRDLEAETEKLSVNLVATYEEISLLYRITQNLRISESDEGLGRGALQWMQEVIPAEALALQLLPVAKEDESLTRHGRTNSVLLSYGECPVEDDEFSRLIGHLGLRAGSQPMVVNPPATEDPTWPFPQVRQMVVVPLAEGDNLFGWLAALNHVSGEEFGTVQASLLSSVGVILGTHNGNIELYRQQSELMAGIVRALTSAIDAKDPYTCGHSDRVARVAVRLAEELGCDQETVDTIYLSGLLHDIGKIGIDDQVLRKPGKLTDEEYEHIKKHVRIGHRILVDLKKLDEVLPVVLHHHESWDGHGYPGRLEGGAIPLSARIVAVADAFDAMGSDRPYRKGMPDEKIDDIFRSGAGGQWDPQVVDAFFRARGAIREIMRGEEELTRFHPGQPA